MNYQALVLKSRSQPPLFGFRTFTISKENKHPLLKVLCFSIDPIMKVWLQGAATNFRRTIIEEPFNCFGLGIIIRNQSQEYPLGAYVFGNTGTQNFCQMGPGRAKEMFVVPRELVEMYGPTKFLYLFNNGLAAYAGLQIMNPKAQESVLISTAAGATGLLLLQLLRQRNINCLCLTSKNKKNYLRKYTKHIADYTSQNQVQDLLNTKFKCYFDNVGQNLLDKVLTRIQERGTIALCGAISNYSNYKERGIRNYNNIIFKRIKMEGINFTSMIPKAYDIFTAYAHIDLIITTISMSKFQQYFAMLLSSGNNIIGKVIVIME